MPLKLDIKRKVMVRSDRVKCVDQHSSEPWIMSALYSGDVTIWNYETDTQIKTFKVCDLPVRAAKFVPRKNWVVTGADDMQIKIFNYNTLEKVHNFEAHFDYIRCVVIHPTQPYILTSSDDLLIKLWNWDRSWMCQQVFERHTHYVMQIVINPKDNNVFASASLDTTVKVWNLGSSIPNFTLKGHEKGVNCVDYYYGADKPYLISGAEDGLVKVWDYQNRTCVQSIENDQRSVSAVTVHPKLPVLLAGLDDGTVSFWHMGIYKLEAILNYGLEHVWTFSVKPGSNNIAIGYEEGTITITVGREEPAISMDGKGSRILWMNHSEIQQVNLKVLPEGIELKDGERIPVISTNLGICDIYPQTIAHNANGRFIVVCGDGEYIIYTALSLRIKAFGTAKEFVWASYSTHHATLENCGTIKVFKNFTERNYFIPEFGAEVIFGGFMLGVVTPLLDDSNSGKVLSFYDWEHLKLIARIEIQPRNVIWSENCNSVCLVTDDKYFILKYNRAVIMQEKQNNSKITENGIEDAFELVDEVNELIISGLWVRECFIYINSVNRLNYYVGKNIITISHLSHTMCILGYVEKENRLYLSDKDFNIVSYSLLLPVLEYQTAVIRGDFETADRILLTIPNSHRTGIAYFLEDQGFKQEALAITKDLEHQFELAISLGELKLARQLAEDADSGEGGQGVTKPADRWSRLGAAAAAAADIDVMKTCYRNAKDFNSLLLFATCTGDKSLLLELVQMSEAEGKHNVTFVSHLMLNDLNGCLDLLIKHNKLAEAAFFARSYIPSKVSEIVKIWRKSIAVTNKRISQMLADPEQYENLFPDYLQSLKLEKCQQALPEN